MSIAGASIHHIYGLKAGVKHNVAYSADDTVVFPAGNCLVVENVTEKSQRVFPCSEKGMGVSAMAISPNKRYVALAEKADMPHVSVYDLHLMKRRRYLTTADMTSEAFVLLAFSPNCMFLVAVGGKPDWTLFCWKWEKSRLLHTMKITNFMAPTVVVYELSFHPTDDTLLCITGSALIRFLRMGDEAIKPFNQVRLDKIELHDYLCHCWVNEERLLIGTDQGCLLFLSAETAELKKDIFLGDEHEHEKRGKSLVQYVSNTKKQQHVSAVVAYSRGFACAYGPGNVILFEKTDVEDTYKRLREIKIPPDPLNSFDPTVPQEQMFRCLICSPNEDNLVACTDKGQTYHYQLCNIDIGKGHANFEVLTQLFHTSYVLCVDVCIRKPYLVTCSLDRSIHVWDYAMNTLELHKVFSEEVYTVALHPLGLFVLAGFSDKMRLMNLLIDDISTSMEFPMKNCNECSFSNGGHMFAVVHGNVIQLYSVTTFENIGNLKGHIGKITSVVWSADDLKIVSCGLDGAVYEWEVTTQKRVGENVIRACNYIGLGLSPDGKVTYAAGQDRSVKEISDSQIVREMLIGEAPLTCLVLSHSGRMMFAGTTRGTLLSIKFPLTGQGEYQEHVAHGGPITKMKMTFGDKYLITVAADGTVIQWRVSSKVEIRLTGQEAPWAEEILITKSDLEETKMAVSELQFRIEEMEKETEYHMRLKDMKHNEKMKELTEKFIREMESLKTKIQTQKTERDRLEAKHEEEMSSAIERHSKQMDDMEATFNHKLMVEFERYDAQSNKIMKMYDDFEKQMFDLEESHAKAIEELTEYYEGKLKDVNGKLQQTSDAKDLQTKEYEESKKQMEIDTDMEVLVVKHNFEEQLYQERFQVHRLKQESGLLKKKLNSLQKGMDEKNSEIVKLKLEITRLKTVIKGLEKDIQGLKKEMLEREEAVGEKEMRIFELKRKNQELEKFKFVLDFKIKELRKQIEPRENEIKSMQVQIKEMERELDNFNRTNKHMELNIGELRQKLKQCDQMRRAELRQAKDVQAFVSRMKTDVYHCVGCIQQPKLLKDKIMKLYTKYVRDEDVKLAKSGTDSIEKELTRQKAHLEQCVDGLRKRVEKDYMLHKGDSVRFVRENSSLVCEINDLRTELKACRLRNHDMQVYMDRVERKLKESAVDADSLKEKPPLSALERMKMAEQKETISLQLTEMRRLRRKVAEAHTRGQLPPL